MLLITNLLLSGRIVMRPKEVQRQASSISKDWYTPILCCSLTLHLVSAVFLYQVTALFAWFPTFLSKLLKYTENFFHQLLKKSGFATHSCYLIKESSFRLKS